jgi:hypothetical protein
MILFAGLWGIADYNGNMEYRPKRIKIETIPYFNDNIEDCIDILENAGFLRRYTVDEKEYLHICCFQKHQNPHKNERDAGTSIPKPTKDGIKTEQEPSYDGSDPADTGFLNPDSLSLIPDSIKDIHAKSPVTFRVPAQAVVDLYHKKLPKHPQVIKLTDARRANIKQRWREDMDTLEAWGEYFDYVAKSEFLTGRVSPTNGRSKPFMADLEWLTKAANIAKVVEGKYHG